MEGERETQLTQMTHVASSSSSAPAVNEEIILEQVLGTRRGHKTGVGRTLSQRVYSGASSSSSHSEGSTSLLDPAVEEYLRRSYEQNLQMYESQRLMQQLLTQLHPNIQFPTITRPEPFVPPGSRPPPPPGSRPPPPLGSQPPPDEGDDVASDTTNLGD